MYIKRYARGVYTASEIANNKAQTQCPLTEKPMNKKCYIHRTKH